MSGDVETSEALSPTLHPDAVGYRAVSGNAPRKRVNPSGVRETPAERHARRVAWGRYWSEIAKRARATY